MGFWIIGTDHLRNTLAATHLQADSAPSTIAPVPEGIDAGQEDGG